MSRAGIVRFSAYLPTLRLSRAAVAAANAWVAAPVKTKPAGCRAMAGWDEDAVTMAVEASRPLVRGGTVVDRIVLASTTLPFADRLNAGIVAAGLDLPRALSAQDVGGSQRAATSALIAAIESAAGTTLLAAGETRRTQPASPLELATGDAAAAVLVGGQDVAAECLGWASETADFVDHHRASDAEVDYLLEDRWVREEAALVFAPSTIEAALAAAGLAAADIDIAVLSLPSLAMAKAAAKAAGLPAQALIDPLTARCGRAGAADPLLLLVHALETAKAGQTILLVGFGQGCDALVFRATDRIGQGGVEPSLVSQLEGGRLEENYLKFLSFTGQLDYYWGPRAERDNRTAQTAAWRKSRDVYGFIGGKCTACGTVQFPKSRGCINPACREYDTQEPFGLADTIGAIKTFTEDWQAFTPDPPLRYGNIAFAEGGNALMEIADCGPGGLAIGGRVRMVFRIKDRDERRGFRRYAWKAAPDLRPGEGG